MSNPFHGGLSDHVGHFSSLNWLLCHHHAKDELRRQFALSLDLMPNVMILDVACGTGGWSETFSTVYPECRVVGFDMSLTNLSWAKRLGRSSNVSSRRSFLAADASRLPFRRESFDVVFVANSLQFRTIEYAVPSLYGLLRPGGRLILRNFDEGVTLLFPCSPDLQAKIIAAAACASTKDKEPIDPYVGRRLKDILHRSFQEPINLQVAATRLEWPFSSPQREYIAGNVAWLGSMAKNYVDGQEYKRWMSLVDGNVERSLFDDESAYYIVFDFCAELTRNSRPDRP